MKKRIILTFIGIILFASIFYCSILCYHKMTSPNTETDIKGKEINKEEYLYKEELLELKYNISDIDVIERKISNLDVKNYLLKEKYDDLISFIDSPYFKIENISRYQLYFDNNDYSVDDVVIYVNIGLDNEFYTNIENANINSSEKILVNKYYKLEENFNAELTSVDKIYGSGQMNTYAYEYFKKMCDDAKEENIILKGVSFYRSYKRQNTLYNSYVKKSGIKEADLYSARPGHSEHQTGLAVDINESTISAHFEKTKEYEWLINNSYKYGFILRYPDNKTFITGYKYEPWHFRYVGIDASTKIYEENITFEEYLIKFSK